MIDRHKVFISYYHKDDQKYKDYLIKMSEWNRLTQRYESVFDDYSVCEKDIEDEALSSEQVRCIIRDEYIRDAAVLVLLCGENTRKRKHIDWEIHAAMFDTQKNPKLGILIINLPTISQWIRASSDAERSLISENVNWKSLTTRQEYQQAYPYMPDRIIDNFIKGASISVVDWSAIEKNPERIKVLIDNAFIRRKNNQYDHSAKLRKNNS